VIKKAGFGFGQPSGFGFGQPSGFGFAQPSGFGFGQATELVVAPVAERSRGSLLASVRPGGVSHRLLIVMIKNSFQL